jgi:salicylate hydroxylase
MLSRPGQAPQTALSAYAAERLRRVRRVQDKARRNSRVYHAGALMALGRDLVMRRLGPDALAERYAWIYGWSPPA